MLYPTTCVGLRYGPHAAWCLEVFLGSMLAAAVTSPSGSVYCRGSAHGWICLPARRLPPFNAPFRRRAGVSLLRHSVAAAAGAGMFTGSSIGVASRLGLRARLTLIRLALIRKPWSCGEGVSRPLCRYLYLHLLFHTLQRGSARAFDASGMLPYRRRTTRRPTASAPGFMPDYYPRATARPVSCYALLG